MACERQVPAADCPGRRMGDDSRTNQKFAEAPGKAAPVRSTCPMNSVLLPDPGADPPEGEVEPVCAQAAGTAPGLVRPDLFVKPYFK